MRPLLLLPPAPPLLPPARTGVERRLQGAGAHAHANRVLHDLVQHAYNGCGLLVGCRHVVWIGCTLLAACWLGAE